MSNPREPREHAYASTYVVQDRQSQEELLRLTIQDQMITAGMGGVFPEQPDPFTSRRVLDIACGTGGWVIEAAKTYPEMELIGIDISKSMLAYARKQAEAQHVADRVEFRVMDATLLLEFSPDSFDLVNLRFGVSFLRTWEWRKLFSELQRVTRSHAILRITEPEMIQPSNSPALTRFFEMMQCGFFRAGHLFEPETTGITAHLPDLFARHSIQQIQTKAYTLEFLAGTAEGQAYAEDMMHGFRTIRPFLERRGCASRDYDAVCQQAIAEMHYPDFHGNWNLLTVWGSKSSGSRKQ